MEPSLPKFDPTTILLDMDDKPIRTGTLSGADRGALAKLHGEMLAAKPEQRPELENSLALRTEELQEVLTTGKAIITALTTGLQGDDSLAGDVKLDNYELAIRVKRSEGPVGLSNAEVERIKARVARTYPSAVVVGQVFAAIKSD